MSVRQTFSYEWPAGTTPIYLDEWIKTLPIAEQQEYASGRANGDQLRQQAINEGRLTILADGSYQWTDQQAFEQHKKNDQIWEKYWNRWQSETGAKFVCKVIQD
jgi:hypothetical protein